MSFLFTTNNFNPTIKEIDDKSGLGCLMATVLKLTDSEEDFRPRNYHDREELILMVNQVNPICGLLKTQAKNKILADCTNQARQEILEIAQAINPAKHKEAEREFKKNPGLA